jgi:hypothetical protein
LDDNAVNDINDEIDNPPKVIVIANSSDKMDDDDDDASDEEPSSFPPLPSNQKFRSVLHSNSGPFNINGTTIGKGTVDDEDDANKDTQMSSASRSSLCV